MNGEYAGPERRKHKRVLSDLPVALTIIENRAGAEAAESYEGRIINMSPEGIAVEISVRPEARILQSKQQVLARLTLPCEGKPLTVQGAAVWSTKIADPSGEMAVLRIGMKMGGIDPCDADKIRAYIEEERET